MHWRIHISRKNTHEIKMSLWRAYLTRATSSSTPPKSLTVSCQRRSQTVFEVMALSHVGSLIFLVATLIGQIHSQVNRSSNKTLMYSNFLPRPAKKLQNVKYPSATCRTASAAATRRSLTNKNWTKATRSRRLSISHLTTPWATSPLPSSMRSSLAPPQTTRTATRTDAPSGTKRV